MKASNPPSENWLLMLYFQGNAAGTLNTITFETENLAEELGKKITTEFNTSRSKYKEIKWVTYGVAEISGEMSPEELEPEYILQKICDMLNPPAQT